MRTSIENGAVRIIGDLPETTPPYGQIRDSIGTGTVMTVPGSDLRSSMVYGYLITAAHVLEGQKQRRDTVREDRRDTCSTRPAAGQSKIYLLFPK